MNCWRTINVKKEYDSSRLMLLSLTVMVATFIFSYLIFSFQLNNVMLKQIGFIETLLFFFLIPPLHTLLHILPLRFAGVRLHTRLSVKPFIKVLFSQPIQRNTYIFSLIFPNFFISAAVIVLIFWLPPYMHYFLFILSFNAGLSVYDFVYMKQLLGAPKHALIDRKQNGMDILVKQPI